MTNELSARAIAATRANLPVRFVDRRWSSPTANDVAQTDRQRATVSRGRDLLGRCPDAARRGKLPPPSWPPPPTTAGKPSPHANWRRRDRRHRADHHSRCAGADQRLGRRSPGPRTAAGRARLVPLDGHRRAAARAGPITATVQAGGTGIYGRVPAPLAQGSYTPVVATAADAAGQLPPMPPTAGAIDLSLLPYRTERMRRR